MAGQPTPSPAPPDFLQKWQSVDVQMPEGAPDTMRDAWREKFYQSNILPWAMAHGHDPELTRQEFLTKTTRAEKSSMPRTALVAKSALEAAAAPALSIGEQLFEQPEGTVVEKRHQSNINIHDWIKKKRADLTQSVHSAVEDAAKQGVWPAPYEMAGGMIGAAVYASPAVKAGAFVAKLAGIPGAAAALEGAVFGGMYEAAKADNGHRLEEGLAGAKAGLVLGAAFGAAGSGLKALLRSRLPAPMASAVESTVKGTATAAEEDLASAALKLDPTIPALVEQHVQSTITANKKVGKPASPPESTNAPLRVEVSDGQKSIFVQMKQPITESQRSWLEAIRQPLGVALDNGAEIKSVQGHPQEVRDFFHSLDTRNVENGVYDSSLRVRGGEILDVVLKADDLTSRLKNVNQRMDELGYPKLEGELSPTSEVDYADLLQKSINARRLEGKAPAPGTSLPSAAPLQAAAASQEGLRSAQITHADAPPSDFIEKTPQGWFRDSRDGAMYMDAADVPGMKARMATNQPWYDQTHSWVTPEGKDIPVASRHEITASEITGIKDSFAAYFSLQKKGYVAVHGMNITAEPSALGSIALDTAVVKAAQAAEANKFPYVQVQIGSVEGKVPVAEVGDFLSDPIKYLRKTRLTDSTAFDESMQSVVAKLRNEAKESTEFRRSLEMEGGKERPLYKAYIDNRPQWAGSEINNNPGEKPTVYLNRKILSADPQGLGREIPYHEGWHAIFSNFGWHEEGAPWLNRIISHAGELHDRVVGKWEGVQQMSDSMTTDLARAFKPSLRSHYEKTGSLPEETYVHLSQAIRFNNRPLMDAFVKADESEGAVLDWHAAKTRDLMDITSMQGDSVAKNIAMRRMTDLLNRSTSRIEDLQRSPAALGADVRMENGKYVVEDSLGVEKHFDSREQLVQHMQEEHGAPLSQGNLVDESLLPQNLPRLATQEPFSDRRPPNHTNPPDFLPEETKYRSAGMLLVSYYTRPFMSWLDTAARKFEAPELYSTFQRIKEAKIEATNFSRPFAQVLEKAVKDVGWKRGKDLGTYLLALEGVERDFVGKELRITDVEKKIVEGLADKLSPLTDLHGVSLENFMRDVAPKLKKTMQLDPHSIRPNDSFVNEKFPDWQALANGVSRGDIDPRDTNLFSVAGEYLRLASRKQFVEPHLTTAAEMVNALDARGNFKLGEIQPLVAKVLQSERGIPDYTQRLVHNTIQSTMDMFNKAIRQGNTTLPASMQIGTFDALPQDVLRKWVQYSYAGSMMLRPMAIVRDTSQIFITTLPVLGAKYLARGMKFAFSAAREGVESNAWKMAEEAGALIGRDELLKFAAAAEGGHINKGVSAAMHPYTWSNNINRLMAFGGHYERIVDALRRGVDESFGSRSAIDFLDPLLRDRFLAEAAELRPGSDAAEKFARRAAKELVDVTQWNYDRLGSPGFHKYALGRLFGQYGTFPLNYIQFATRLAKNGSPQFRAENLARLAAAHFAVLAAGQASGVDTAQWVFTQPMAYGGGPMYQAATQVLGTMDFESRRGAEARREVVRPFFPMGIPGGLAAEQTWKAVVKDDPNLWKIVLGFQPLRDEGKGLHKMFDWE